MEYVLTEKIIKKGIPVKIRNAEFYFKIFDDEKMQLAASIHRSIEKV